MTHNLWVIGCDSYKPIFSVSISKMHFSSFFSGWGKDPKSQLSEKLGYSTNHQIN